MIEMVGYLWIFQLALIGILVPVLTLLLNSLVSKVESQKTLSKSSHILLQSLSIRFENEMVLFRNLNRKVIISLIVSTVLLILRTFGQQMKNHQMLYMCLLWHKQVVF